MRIIVAPLEILHAENIAHRDATHVVLKRSEHVAAEVIGWLLTVRELHGQLFLVLLIQTIERLKKRRHPAGPELDETQPKLAMLHEQAAEKKRRNRLLHLNVTCRM